MSTSAGVVNAAAAEEEEDRREPTTMDIDDDDEGGAAVAAHANKKKKLAADHDDDGNVDQMQQLQLPWVEKYRPERYVFSFFATLNSPKARKFPLMSGDVHAFLNFYFSFVYSLEDLVAQDDIIQSITNLIDSNNLPHLLLYGPPGTGKTSTIVAAAKRMYGGSAAYSRMTLELNASDARGINVRSPSFFNSCVFVARSSNARALKTNHFVLCLSSFLF